MGRFSNLEFDANEERREEPRRHEAERDEKFYMAQANDALRDGRFQDALRAYSRSLEFDAHLADAWLGQVLALVELGEAREAQVWADKGLEQFRGHGELTAAKGVALGRQGARDEALALSDAAMAEKGESAYRWRARGDVLLSREDRNEEFCFSRAMAAAGGKDWWEPLSIGRVYLHYGKAAPAVRHFEAAVDRNAQSAFAWAELARGLEKLGMAEKARKALGNARDLDPSREFGKISEHSGSGFLASLVRMVKSWLGK